MEHPKVLVFVEFPDPEFPTGGFLNHFVYPDAKIVGFYQLDDDMSVQEVEAEYGDEFTAELEKQAEKFEQRGVRTEYDLIYGQNQVEARQRVAQTDDIDAILIPGGTNTLGKVLIASRHTQNAEEKVTTLLNIIDRSDLISVDLIHIADPDDPEGEDEGERVLKEITSILTDEDIPSVQINREVRTGKDVAFELNQAARNYDLVVMGETQQDTGDKIFGPVGQYQYLTKHPRLAVSEA
jgi:nucleotide-binding universal stress UspA family protein